MALPTFQDVQGAAELLQGIAHKTPIHTSRQLNEISQAVVYLKCENFQRVGAFTVSYTHLTLPTILLV